VLTAADAIHGLSHRPATVPGAARAPSLTLLLRSQPDVFNLLSVHDNVVYLVSVCSLVMVSARVLSCCNCVGYPVALDCRSAPVY
jgi:hypothetical protein